MANNFSFNEYLVIDTTGSVGIGSTNPIARFYVTGSSTTTSQTTAIFRPGTANQTAGAAVLDVQNSTGTSLFFVSGSGNIGVGTSVPNTSLSVYNSSLPSISLWNSSNYTRLSTSGNDFYLDAGQGSAGGGATIFRRGSGTAEHVRFDSSGNVGIGTSIINSKLFVYTNQNDASTTPSFDFNGAFMRIGDYTTNLSFTNGVGIKIHDGGVIHYSVGQISGKFLISDTSNDGNALFPASRSDIIAISSTNVGIGTTLIDSKLVVNGNTVISGTLNPDTDAARDLGTSLKRWRTLFAANISGSLTPTGATSGSVFFAGASGQIQQDNSNFFWDDTNNRLGIGTATPTTALDVNGVVNAATGYRIAGGATNGYVLKGNGTNFVSAQLSYSELSGTPTIGDATLTVGVSGTGLSISATPTFTANATSNKTITITSNATSSNTVSTIVARDANGDFNAGRINVIIDSSDTRAVTTTPETLARAGVVFDFKTNGTNALTDGGSYHGLMTFRQYGSTTDWSGGRSHQLGFTDNDNVWHRSGTSTTWGTWYKFYHTGNLTNPTTGTGTASYVSRFTGTSTLGNSVIQDDGTRVGVGTTGTSSRATVYGTSTGSDTTLLVRHQVANGSNLPVLDVQNSSNASLLFVSGSGNVGIGTSTPTAALHVGSVVGTTAAGPALKLNHSAGSGYGYAQFGNSSTATQNWHIGSEGDGSFRWYSGNWGAGTELMRINSAGQVGIGTASPNAVLDVSKSSGAVDIRLSNGGTAYMNLYAGSGVGAVTLLAVQSEALVLGTSNAEKMRIDSSGNVGINTASMTKKLVVHGSDALINDLTVGRGGVASNVGSSNTAIGYGAGASLSVGYSYNTSIGGSALTTNAAGERNTALGNSSLLNYNPTASTGDSTAVGYASLYSSTTGISNTAVGSYSLYSATTTSYNTAIGVEAMRNGIVMDRSVAVGYRAMYVAGGDDDNVAVGYQSAYSLDKGDRCTAIGSISLFNMKDNTDSTAVGYASLYANTGSYNTSMGSYSLVSNTTGTGNVAVGYAAGLLNSTASGNVAVGYQAMYSNTTASGSVSIGYEALYSSTGADNTAIGWWAGRSLSTGNNSVAVGSNALRSATTTASNVAVGYRALELSTGTSNTALGTAAGYRLTTGGSNVAIGALALAASSTLSGSTAVGTGALAAATGDGNTGLGYLAGSSITSGTGNVVVGSYSGNSGGLDIRTSNNNIILSDGQGTVRMHIDYTGAVGIGTTTALGGYTMHLYSGSAKNTYIFTQADADYYSGYVTLAGTNQAYFYAEGTGAGTARLGTATSRSLRFDTGTTEALRIDTSQRIGIGTSSPSNKVHIYGSANDTVSKANSNLSVEGGAGGNGLIFGTYTTSPYASYIQSGYLNNLGLGTYAIILNPAGGKIGIGATATPSESLEAYGTDAGLTVHYTSQSRGGIWAFSTQRVAFASTNANDDLVFGYTGSPGTSAAFTERMRVDNSTGHVGIGTATPDKGRLHVNGYANPTIANYTYYAYGNPYNIGYYSTSSTPSVSVWASDRIVCSEFNAVSDERLKIVEKDLSNKEGLDFINKCKPILYKWKYKEEDGHKFGFSAQQIIKSGYPNLVSIVENRDMKETIDSDGFKSPEGINYVMNYDNVVPLITAAMKGLKQENDSLKSEIQSLKDQISSILAMLSNK